MSEKVGETICDDNEQDSPVSASQRYFKAQTTFQGNCLVCSINNALGEPVLCVNSLRQRVKTQREPSKRVPLLHRQNKLFSFHLAVEALNVSNIRVVKLSGFRTPREKFEFLLNVTEGRYIALTNLNDDTQRRGSHDLDARNVQHWIAVSGDERLVIDSLARRLGPQKLAESTLTRSVRKGIVRVYRVVRSERH